MYNNMLQLIKTVNDNHSHISELEALGKLLRYCKDNPWILEEERSKLEIICMTTLNRHYDYRLFTNFKYQNPANHIDIVLETNSQEENEFLMSTGDF